MRSPTSLRELDDATREKLLAMPSNDEVFADAIRHSRVVVGQSTSTRPAAAGEADAPVAGYGVLMARGAPDPRQFFHSYPSLVHNVPVHRSGRRRPRHFHRGRGA